MSPILVCLFMFKDRRNICVEVLLNLKENFLLVNCYEHSTHLITHISHWKKNTKTFSLQKMPEEGDKLTV